MKTTTLNNAQRAQIFDELRDVRREAGCFNVEVHFEGINLTISGRLDIDGYVEDDFRCGYMNGTGGFVETDRLCQVDIDAFDDEGDDISLDEESINNIEEYLNTKP